MAIVRLGHLIGGISGNIASINFANTRAGVVARQRARPVNHRSEKQLMRRSRYAYFAAAWPDLSLQQRDAWRTEAAQIPFINRLSQPIHLSGFTYFMTVHLTKAHDQYAIIEVPFTQSKYQPPSSFTAAFTAGAALNISIFPTPRTILYHIRLFLSRPVSSSPRKHWPVWTYCDSIIYGAAVQTRDWATNIEQFVGVLRQGEIVGLKIQRYVNGALVSTALEISTTVA